MRKFNISKELIAKIYKDLHPSVKEILKVEIKGKTKNVYVITYTDFDDLNEGYISASQSFYADAFFFTCKAWALDKGYQIISGPSDEPAHRKQDEKAYAKVLWYEGDDTYREYKDMYFMANTEVEAVIKASEYVLKEINERFKNK